MRKYFVLIPVVAVAFLLSGCGNNGATSIISSKPQTTRVAQYINDSGTTLTQEIPLMQLTDPTLYDYLLSTSQLNGVSQSTGALPQTSSKTGILKTFDEDSSLGLSGSVQILSSGNGYDLSISQFSYNGSCGKLTFALVVSSSPRKPVYSFTPISGPVTNTSYTFEIPSTILLSQFDRVSLFCSGDDKPISGANFN